jgi:hypothetical protein
VAGKWGPTMTVERLARDQAKRQPTDDMWLRRQGVSLIPYLPEDPTDAIAVLHYAETFYRKCVMNEPPPDKA